MSRWLLNLALVLIACGCGRSANSAGPGGVDAGAVTAAMRVRPPEVDDLWTRAAEAEADDLARLANREGTTGLIERGSDPAFRKTAILALAYAEGYDALPFLAEIAGGTDEANALLAAQTAVDIASRPRRSVDPEDALEVREGCDRFLVIAKQTQKPRRLRVAIVRALRMFADLGFVKPADIPTDVDAH